MVSVIRRRNTVSLRRQTSQEEDINPSAYFSNIADCMLVLMLGFLVALVMRYNVTLNQDQSDEIEGVQVNLDADGDGVIDSNYQQQGTVYYDESTDTYYMVDTGSNE